MPRRPRLTTHRIGEWRFDTASGELRRGADCRRLEPRAARTLALLSEAGGAIVPQDRIIAEVWNGRRLSDNSVPVVISQLRRLLDDDARRPVLIETVPKRGYRLVAERRSTGDHAWRTWAVVLIIAAAAAALLWAGSVRGPDRPVIAVTGVVNLTGNPGYDPLARATSELIVAQLAQRGFDVRRGGNGGDLKFTSKLVMWHGGPSLGMTAAGPDGVVRWSAMISGTADQVPAGVRAELDRLEKTLPGR